MPLPKRRDVDAGSRMHMLDWVESEDFLASLRNFVQPIGFTVAECALWQPKGRQDFRETVLVDGKGQFLTPMQQERLTAWWLVHRRGAKLPTWDLAVSAFDALGRNALILVEAKAHATELSSAGKRLPKRETAEAQERSKANHERIGKAIEEANVALQQVIPTIAISRDKSFQLANRIAFAWKLASMGVPLALIYLGFIGDTEIVESKACLLTPADWEAAFQRHTEKVFPENMQERYVDCGTAGFWLLVRDIKVLRKSPPIEQRRLEK